MTAGDEIRRLDQLLRQHGRPACLRSDNGPQLVSEAVQTWLKAKQVDTHYIEPGSPWQSPYSESFNSPFRTTCLDRWVFSSLTETRVVINQWLDEYSTIQPHGSLGGMNPERFLQQWIEGNETMQQPKSLTG